MYIYMNKQIKYRRGDTTITRGKIRKERSRFPGFYFRAVCNLKIQHRNKTIRFFRFIKIERANQIMVELMDLMDGELILWREI